MEDDVIPGNLVYQLFDANDHRHFTARKDEI
jgi:hypothetical protein